MGAEALRLRAKAEGWAKPMGMVGEEQSNVGKPKYANEKPKHGKVGKSKHGKDGPSLDHDDFELVDEPASLLKPEHENESTLTPKEERFVGEYLIDLNATQAAIRSGYSAKSARQIGAENLSKPYIAAAIAEAQAERTPRTEITSKCRLILMSTEGSEFNSDPFKR